MAVDLYSRLSDVLLLKKSWHLARSDSRSDFIYDPYRFTDFAFRLDEHLKAISQSLANGTYHPKPLLTVDVPKSSLSVRPGSALAIEDRIVLFAITQLIAPRLDKYLPKTVYSWRVRKSWKEGDLFRDHEFLKFPFLKRRTIVRRLDIVEPWYGVWPKFVHDIEYAHEKEEYRYLVLSDIVSYFENIDLPLLRDLLKHYLPQQGRIINFLVDLLEYWAWPTLHSTSAPRGIPQGNAVSSFLGNIYLLPLDLKFLQLSKRRNIRYFRYMDDVKVLAKHFGVAREALFLMNEELRSLRLNIQGAKTRILHGEQIKDELFDDRLDAVNKIIDDIKTDTKKKQVIDNLKRKQYVARLKVEVRKIKGKKEIIRDKELRLFRRLITAFTLLRDPSLVKTVLDQLSRNPDSRLLNSAIRYLKSQRRSRRTTAELSRILRQDEHLFPYQKAHLFMLMRTLHEIPGEVVKLARREVRRKNCNWYVRQQAALLLGARSLVSREVRGIVKQYEGEQDVEVKRAWIPALVQQGRDDLLRVARGLVFSVHPKLQQMGRLIHGLMLNANEAREQSASIFRNQHEDVINDRLFEIEVIARNGDSNVRDLLDKKLSEVQKYSRYPLLKERIERIRKGLQNQAQARTRGRRTPRRTQSLSDERTE